MLYFDHNATTPLHPAARDAWLEAAETLPGNPSSPHRIGARAEAAMNTAREDLAGCLGCDPLDLVWTSGATESANHVFHHARQTLPEEAEVWVSAVEHPCVMASAGAGFGDRMRKLPVDDSGRTDLGAVRQALFRKPPGLVAVMAANNETGVLQPWPELRRLCSEAGVPFFCDAAQWLGKEPAAGLGACDWVAGCAHKFGGPKGIGFLKVPASGPVAPYLLGGPQEERRRAGTENVPGILAMTAMLRFRERQMAEGEVAKRRADRDGFIHKLQTAFPELRVLGEAAPRLWNTVSVVMPEADCRTRWVVKLDKLGLAVSTGSACSSGREKPSQVMRALGLSPAEAGRVLRFSGGWETISADWDRLLEGLREVWRELAAVEANGMG